MQWVAYYKDGTALPQFQEGRGENRYADIDRDRLITFALFDGDESTRLVFSLHLDPGQRLIYRRRVTQPTGPTGQPFIVHMVGWQQTVNGSNLQSIAYIFPDGSIHSAGQWKEGHPWFYAIQPVEAEK